MFGQLLSLKSWDGLMRGTLVGAAAVLLAPAALITLGMVAFVLLPVAVVGIPFLAPALLGGASAEHADAVRRSHYPVLQHAHGVA